MPAPDASVDLPAPMAPGAMSRAAWLLAGRDAASIADVTALISHTSFDCQDAYALSVFWGNVLGFVQDADNPDAPGDEECMIFSPDGSQRLLFIEVPEPKQVKNRLHLDLKPADGTRDDELARLLELGARTVDDRRMPDGTGWVVLADPEGNEFCILRSDAERAG